MSDLPERLRKKVEDMDLPVSVEEILLEAANEIEALEKYIDAEGLGFDSEKVPHG